MTALRVTSISRPYKTLHPTPLTSAGEPTHPTRTERATTVIGTGRIVYRDAHETSQAKAQSGPADRLMGADELDARSMLPADMLPFTDRAYYLLDLILRKRMSWKASAKGFVRLQAQLLRKQLGHRVSLPLIETLERVKVIERFKKANASRITSPVANASGTECCPRTPPTMSTAYG